MVASWSRSTSKTDLVDRRVRHITAVGVAAFVTGRVLRHRTQADAEGVEQQPHPLGVAGGEVVVDGDDMHTTPGQHVSDGRDRTRKRLALTGRHLHHIALEQAQCALQLDVEGTHIQCPVGHPRTSARNFARSFFSPMSSARAVSATSASLTPSAHADCSFASAISDSDLDWFRVLCDPNNRHMLFVSFPTEKISSTCTAGSGGAQALCRGPRYRSPRPAAAGAAGRWSRAARLYTHATGVSALARRIPEGDRMIAAPHVTEQVSW